MDRIVVVQEKVEDLYGLYMDLRRSEFAVRNVGADQRGTYVYVDETETKDPVPFVKTWIGKPAPEPSASLKKKRIKEFDAVLEVEKKAAEERRAAELAAAEEEAKKSGVAVGMELIGAEVKAENKEPAAPVAFQDTEGNVIGELLDGTPKESVFKRIWKKLF